MSMWEPHQYRRFADERAQPFHDLVGLVRPGGIARAVDLGCGDASTTVLAADRLGIARITGIDNSPSMLADAARISDPRLEVVDGDIGTWTAPPELDLVLSNAALQWVPDHRSTLARWTAALAPGGQLAVQVPANAGQPSHLAAAEVAASPEFADDFGPDGPPADPVAVNVLAPEDYAVLLHELGFVEQHVRLQVYPHVLGSTRDIVEWVKGTTLTRFKARLAPHRYDAFIAAYTTALLERVGDRSPCLFPFRRILLWARLPD